MIAVGPLLVIQGLAGWWYDSRLDQPMLRFPKSIAVSPFEEIFVYTDWGVIRVCDRDGVERKRWYVDASDGTAVLAFDASGVLHVGTVRNRMHYEYDAKGKLLQQTEDAGAFDRLARSNGRSARAPSGETYSIRNGAIVRASASGAVTTVVPGPPIWFPESAPHPLFLVPIGLIAPAIGAALYNWSSGAAGGSHLNA
jgi:hypothetical protein